MFAVHHLQVKEGRPAASPFRSVELCLSSPSSLSRPLPRPHAEVQGFLCILSLSVFISTNRGNAPCSRQFLSICTECTCSLPHVVYQVFICRTTTAKAERGRRGGVGVMSALLPPPPPPLSLLSSTPVTVKTKNVFMKKARSLCTQRGTTRPDRR
ncbi:unnamed protein product [Ectocarpus sp. 13 AM-2016]